MIKEESIRTAQGNGILYSTEINGERYVSQIVLTELCKKNDELLSKWKAKAKKQVEDLIYETRN